VPDTNVIVGFFTSRTRRSDNARVFDAWLVSQPDGQTPAFSSRPKR
jgi:hypothetical protein